MTAATGLKRLGFALAAVIVAGAGLVLAMPLLVSTDTVRERVKSEISAVTGLNPVMRGEAAVSLFPATTVSFSDVALGEAARPALRAERVIARVRFFPLLLGRVEIADVTLVRPAIMVNIAADGRTNWSGLMETLARSRRPNETSAAFSEIRVIDGRVTVHDAARDISETFDTVEFSVAWPSISRSFGATGRFAWRGEPVEASIALSDFANALAGSKTGVKLRLAGAPIKAAFDGTMSALPTLRVEGTLAADGASLRDFLRWTGKQALPGGGFGRFALKAQTSVVGGTIALSGVNVEFDGNTAEGVLTFATDGRQTLQGTLAADSLDFTPYISTARVLTASQREWSNGRLTLDGLTNLDIDLRLSAAKVTLANAKFGRTAVGANLRGGHLTVTVGESQAFGGVIKGAISVANLETGVDIKTQLQFTDVDLEQCLGQLIGVRRIEGKGNLAFVLEGSGDSVLAITRTISGAANLTGQNGALAGLNIEQLLRRLERRPLSGGGELRNGRTPYDRLAVNLKIANGLVTAEDAKVEGPAVRVKFGGTATIPTRDLDLKGTASLVPDKGKDSFELPFVVLGTWDNPAILPDPQILIRRSGAAAPLLDAVRDRRARDSVRSVIERLTGAPAEPPAADATSEPKPAE